LLEIKNLNSGYGDLQVLWDVSLKVPEGACVSVVGANGAGKSTLLRTISGLLQPSSGTVEYNGKSIEGLIPHEILKLGIAHVPEGRLLFGRLSVMENLELGAYLSWGDRAKAMSEVFELFPILEERKSQLAETLSGGEQQMLAIGRGMMSAPSLLMLDEPSLGLAPKLVLQTMDIIKKLNARGISVLIVEQNVRLVLALASWTYVLETGRVVLEGDEKKLSDDDHVKTAYLGM
jgi:branched-chain amino acid transport system ATP-binding protein